MKLTQSSTDTAVCLRSARYLRVTIKRGLLLFWAAWLAIVCLTNLFDWLKSMGALSEHWRFASNNYGLMAATLEIYGARSLTMSLFLIVTVWEGVASFLFWRALISRRKDRETAYLLAFAVSLPIWAAFMLADEFLIAYSLQSSHMRIFIAQLVSLLALELLPGPSDGSESPVDSNQTSK